MTHICASKLPIIGSDNGLSPGRRQAIIWTNAGILLLIRTLGTNGSEILSVIHTFSFTKMHFKVSSGKWRLFRFGLNELTDGGEPHQKIQWKNAHPAQKYNKTHDQRYIEKYLFSSIPQNVAKCLFTHAHQQNVMIPNLHNLNFLGVCGVWGVCVCVCVCVGGGGGGGGGTTNFDRNKPERRSTLAAQKKFNWLFFYSIRDQRTRKFLFSIICKFNRSCFRCLITLSWRSKNRADFC